MHELHQQQCLWVGSETCLQPIGCCLQAALDGKAQGSDQGPLVDAGLSPLGQPQAGGHQRISGGRYCLGPCQHDPAEALERQAGNQHRVGLQRPLEGLRGVGAMSDDRLGSLGKRSHGLA
jgi:hypothetical protein